MGYTIKHEKKHTMDKHYRNFVILNKSNHSYAINNKITSQFNQNSWLNRRCFIIGGGESLKGFDYSQLDNELTISINKLFEVYPRATISYSMDSEFYRKLKTGLYNNYSTEDLWNKWHSLECVRVFLTPMEIMEFGSEVNLVRRKWEPSISRGDLDDGIYGGIISGTGALNLAIALGANPIYLLGYDMHAVKYTHCHGGYDSRTLENFNIKLRDYRVEIESMSKLIAEVGVTVVNLNKESKLQCFSFGDLQEVLKN